MLIKPSVIFILTIWLSILVSLVVPIIHFNHILTWNSQRAHWDALSSHLRDAYNNPYDIAFIQESGDIPSGLESIQRHVSIQDIGRCMTTRHIVNYVPLSGAIDRDRDDPIAPDLDPRSLDGTRLSRVLTSGSWNNVREVIWHLGTRSRSNNYYVYHYSTSTANSRVSMAIVTRMRARRVYLFVDRVTNNRPIMGLFFEESNSYVFNVHAPAFAGNRLTIAINDITRLLFEEDGARLGDDSPHHWIFAGDFNRPNIAHLLTDRSHTITQQIIQANGGTHQSGSMLDYIIAGHTVAYLPRLYRGTVTPLASDHNAIDFELIERERSDPCGAVTISSRRRWNETCSHQRRSRRSIDTRDMDKCPSEDALVYNELIDEHVIDSYGFLISGHHHGLYLHVETLNAIDYIFYTRSRDYLEKYL